MREKSLLIAAMTLLPFTTAWGAWEVPHAGSNLGAVDGGDLKNAQEIIDKRCTACHTSERINAAIASGKNMAQIQQSMGIKGAQLTGNEHKVLGIFWKQTPLKEKK